MTTFRMTCSICFVALLISAQAAAPRGATADKDGPAQAAEKCKDARSAPQQAERFEGQVTIPVEFKYLLSLPQGYETGDERWPLLVFLHGSGERGSDLDLVKKHGPPKLIAEGKQFPFIVLSPQAARRGWEPYSLNALIEDVMRKYRVDKDRVYLTGLSMGGYGTWLLAATFPDKFAAIAPICGGGDPADAGRLKDLPVWVFHGAKDDAVPIQRSEEMVDALKEAGSKSVKFTVYPEAGHDSWTDTYNDPELYHWLLMHRVSERK